MNAHRIIRWSALGGLVLAQVVIAVPRANAAQVPLTVRISRVLQVENPDGDGSDGDYYAKVKIGANSFESSGVTESSDFRPNYTFTKSVDDTKPTIVQIELWDEDGGFAGGDDFMDINPTDNAVSLTFTVDPVTRTWTSPDLPANAVVARGDGDHGFPAPNDGRIAQLEFDFSVGGGSPDIDGDGIPDAVERFGVRNLDGTFVPGGDLASLGADPCRKSVAVQIDYLSGAGDGHTHQPKSAAIAEVVSAFNAAPTAAVTPCPYPGTHKPTGLDFVAIPGKSIAEQAVMGFDSSYRGARSANFPSQLEPYAHYAIFVHDQAAGSSSSGLCCDNQRGNKDILISLGSWRTTCVGPGPDGVLNSTVVTDDQVVGTSILVGPNRSCESTAQGDDVQFIGVGTGAANAEVGTVRDQSGSIMHELGHALGLGHGGVDKTNYKPNYLSVMNYSFDPGGIVLAGGASRLDYSRTKLPDLNKTSLSESAGIGDGTDFTSWLDGAGKSKNGRGNGALDWDGDGAINASNVNVNVNSNDDDPALNNPLKGFDDWSNLKFRAVDSPTASGASASMHGPDITFSAVVSRELNIASFFAPDLTATKTVDHLDAEPGDTLHYVVTTANVGTGPATSVTATDTLPDGTLISRTLADAPPGTSQAFPVSFVIPCAAPNLSTVVNQVTVAGKDAAGDPEKKTTNNSASVSSTVHAPVLNIVTTASSPSGPGSAVRISVTITNTGSATARNVMLADTLGVEEYYSTALDQGVGPRPNTVVRNGDGTTTLGWTIATISSTASVTIEFTARPSLLLHSGDVKVAAASAAATNTNGCVVAPVNASASTLIAEVPISGRPISHGRWRTDSSLRTDEIRARVQATDQRFDVSPVIGELSDAEAVTGLKGDNGQATELRSRLLATLLNLANRAVSSSTSVDSVQARRLGIVDVASVVRYAEATLALDPVANSSRYIDAKQLLDAINGPG